MVKKEGAYKSFYPNGNLKEEYSFSNNKPIGEFKTYFDNGQVYQSGNYIITKSKKDGLSGIYKEYYANGQIAKEENYNNNGELNGKQKEHDPDGALIYEGNFKNGKKDGIFRYYRNGEIVKEEEFKNGVLIQKPKN